MLIDCILNPSDVVYNDAVLLTRLSNAPSTLFSKLRFVAKNNATCYIDVYYNVNNHNPFTIMLVAGVNVTILDTLIPNAQIPEGYSVKEFDLTSTAVRGRGGVKHYGITLYDLGKKGGRHEFGNKTLDSRHIDKCRPKSFYLPRNRKGLKRCSSRSFVLLSEYSKYPLRLGSRNNFFWRNHEISGGHRTDRRHKILTLLSSRSCNLVSLGCKIAGKEVAA